MSKAVPTKTPRPHRFRFLHEVMLELKKVKWPTAEDVWQLTSVVLVTIVLVGAFVGVLDFVFSRLFTWIGMYGRV